MKKPWILNDISKKDMQNLFEGFDENWTETHVRINSSDIASCGLVFWLLYQKETILNQISFYGNIPEKVRIRNGNKIRNRFMSYFQSQKLAKDLQNILLSLLKENFTKSSNKEDRETLNNYLKQFRLDGLMWDSQSVAKLFIELFNVQIVLSKEDYLIVKTRLLEMIENFQDDWENKVIVDGKDLLLDTELGLKHIKNRKSRFLYQELYRSVYAESRELSKPYQCKVLECIYQGLKEKKYYEKSEIAKKIDYSEKAVKNSIGEINKIAQECVKRDILEYSNKGQSKHNNIVFSNDLLCVKIETERNRRKQQIKSIIK